MICIKSCGKLVTFSNRFQLSPVTYDSNCVYLHGICITCKYFNDVIKSHGKLVIFSNRFQFSPVTYGSNCVHLHGYILGVSNFIM